ncbi:MAG: acyl-CoA thioesterase [Bacteroidota bacterium]|nr:acyl-CoA thioesterase [Bacteroidota bacterium]
MDLNSKLPNKLIINIDWSDVDVFAHVNNVMIFKYIQAARVSYWQRVGISVLPLEDKPAVILASCNCDFKKPLFFPGLVYISSGCCYLGNSSFKLIHEFRDDASEICAIAEDVIVMFDYELNTSKPIEAALRTKILELEA